MLIFATSLILLFIAPGPGVLSIAGVGSAFGYRAGWRYGVGLFVGSNLVMLAAAFGLAALFLADQRLRVVFTVLSTLYLCYLAAKIAFAGTKIAFLETKSPPSFLNGVTLQIINPKAYAVGTFVFSNFPLWPQNFFGEIALKLLILNVIWIPIHAIWLWVGVTINRLDLPQKTQRFINIAMALAMLAVVGLAISTSVFAR